MLDQKLLYKYCDDLLRLLKENRTTRNTTQYSTGKYRTEFAATGNDIFAAWGIDEDFGIAIVEILESRKLINSNGVKLTYRENGRNYGSWALYITGEGEHFLKTASFEQIYEYDVLQTEIEKTNYEKTKQDLAIGEWLLKTKWLPHIFSIVGITWGVYIFIDAKVDNKKQTQQIEDLQTKLQETKNEISHKVDSLWKIEHTVKPEKKK